MWLINTSSLELKHVVDSTHVAYIVLSHTWGDSEVTFHKLSQPESRSKAGFAKIENTCSLARKQGFEWAWVDTCCIDKTSSAELSEAINSMFTWYRDSRVCFVYLADLEPILAGTKESDRGSLLVKHLPQCRWFTRGWTLQELIASRNLEFYDKEWNFVGRKSELEDLLSRITNIDASVLRDSSRLRAVPVARRMSWASTRQTTRKEDLAYCLLGIFDINMPLLYGEGEKAFLRLQEAIATEINDLSMFAWQRESSASDKDEQITRDEFGYTFIPSRFGGIFASSPLEFRHCTTIRRHPDSIHTFTMTGNGILIRDLLELKQVNPSSPFHNHYLLDLGCVELSERTNGEARWLSIYVAQIGRDYIRAVPDKVASHKSRTWLAKSWEVSRKKEEPVLIRKSLLPGEHTRIATSLESQVSVLWRESFPLQIKLLKLAGYPYSLFEERGGPINFAFHNPGYENIVGMVNLHLVIDVEDDDLIYPSSVHDLIGDWTDQKGAVHCVIVCGLEWREDHLEPWGAIYTTHDNLTEDGTRLANEIIAHARSLEDVVDNRPLAAVKDIMLREYSDVSGYMVQEAMPQWVILRSERTHHFWKLSLKREVVANGGHTKRLDFDQGRLKEYVIWLECHEVNERIEKLLAT